MTKKNVRKVEARTRQAKVGGKYTDHLKKPEEPTLGESPPYDRDALLSALLESKQHEQDNDDSNRGNAPPLNYKAREFLLEFLRWLQIHGVREEGALMTQGENEVLIDAERRIDAFVDLRHHDAPKALRSKERPSPLEIKLLNIRNSYLLHYQRVERCVNSKERLIGIKAPNERAYWTPLTQVKDAPEFTAWWQTLPEATPYDEGFPQIPTPVLTAERLAELFEPIQNMDDRVVRVWLHVNNYAQLRKHAGKDFEPTNQREVILAGIMGYIYNAQVRVSKAIPQGFVSLIGYKKGDADIKADVDTPAGWRPTRDQLTAI